MPHKLKDFVNNLKSIANQPQNCLAKEVAIEALNYDTKEIKYFFEDLLQHGCISGMVSSLIYYSDTNAFFDEHYYEIMELKVQYEEDTGQPMEIPYQLKNYLTWFAFEETARMMWNNFQEDSNSIQNFSPKM